MFGFNKFRNTIFAGITATVLALSSLAGASPAFAATFVPTSAATSTNGTQVLLHTAVSINTGSPKISADFGLVVNGVTRASTTYTVGFNANDVVLTLSSGTLLYSDVVTVSYSRSGNNKITQTGAGSNFMANTASPLSVTNNVPMPDTTPPVFTAMTANSSGTNIAISYNEPLLTSSVPAASDFTLMQNSVIIPNTSYTVSVSGSMVTLTFGSPTIVYNASVFLSYAVPGSGAIKDLAGNSAVAITNNHVTNPVPDTTAPRVIGRSTNTAGTIVTVFFDESLSTTNVPDPSDFYLAVNSFRYPAASTSVDINGSTVNLHLNGAPVVFGDSLFISYTHNVNTAKQIQDLAHNIGNSTDNEQVVNNVPDLGAPLLDFRQTNDLGTTVTLHYTYPLLTSSVPTAGDYALTVNGTSYTNFTPSISGQDVILTLNGASIFFGTQVTVSYSGTSVKRASNSVAAATFGALAVDNLVTAPGAPTAIHGETSVDGRFIYITMSKPLLTNQVPLASDFLVEFDSAPYTGTFTVAVTDSLVTLTLSTPAANLTYVEVAYTPGLVGNRLKSQDGAEALAWIDLDVTNRVPDITGPTVVSRVTNTAGTKLIITFSEQLCETCLPLTSDLYLVFDGTRYDPADYTMSISGATYTFTLTGPAITYGQTLRLSYVPNSAILKRVQDVSGNLLPATNNAVITNLVPDSGAPAVTSKSTNQNGTAITVAYDRSLDTTSVPLASEYAITINGISYTGGVSIAISGSSAVVTLLGSPIVSGSTVTLTYSGSSIKSQAGLSAPTFTNNVVSALVRPELVTLATDNSTGRTIFMTYNVPLNASSIPNASDFVLTINVVAYSTSDYTVAITSNSVILALQLTGAAIKQTDVVRLVYNSGSAPIQDTNGNLAANLALTVVSNRVPDTTKPENISLTTNTMGSQIVWAYNEPLDPARTPLASDIVLTVNGVVYSNTLYTVSVDDSQMVITLNGDRIRFGQAVNFSYTPGLVGNRLADPAGNQVDAEPLATVVNQVASTAVPSVSSMVTNAAGNLITVTYNRPLDTTSVPQASDFVLTLNDVVYSNTNFTVNVIGSSVQLALVGGLIPNAVRVDLRFTSGLIKLQDLDGGWAESFEKTRVTNLVPDTTAPFVTSRVTNTAGNQILITFSEPLNESKLPLPSDIALVFDGVRYDPANYTVSITGSVFTFHLTGPAIRYGQTLRLSYTRNLSNSDFWVQDLAGNLVNNSVSQSIDNLVPDTATPTLVSATSSVLGDKVLLNYNYPLNSTSTPSSSDFVLRLDGLIYSSGSISVSVSGSLVTLNLGGLPIVHDQNVVLTYSGTAVKRSANAVSAGTFSNLTVINSVPDMTAPVVLLRDEITIHVGDTAVTTATADDLHVTWSEALDESGWFTIDSATGTITASAAAPVGTYSYTITATNDAGLQSEATILVMVRPTPIVISNGAGALPPLATIDRPVTAVTTPVAETLLVARVENFLGDRVVSVLEPVGGVEPGSTIAVKPGPAEDESLDGRFTISVTVTGTNGENVINFQKIFTIDMGLFIDGTVPAHSSDGTNWPVLPRLQGDWLPSGGHDGYYVDGRGHLIILTRHLTYFGLKKNQELIHDLRIVTGERRVVVGGEFNFKTQGGLGAGALKVESLTPELCSIQADESIHALAAGICIVRATKVGDGVYADASSDDVRLVIDNPSAKLKPSGELRALTVDLGTLYAGKTVSILMSTPVEHAFKLYRRVTLDDDGIKRIRAVFDSHATFKVLYGKTVVVDAIAND